MKDENKSNYHWQEEEYEQRHNFVWNEKSHYFQKPPLFLDNGSGFSQDPFPVISETSWHWGQGKIQANIS